MLPSAFKIGGLTMVAAAGLLAAAPSAQAQPHLHRLTVDLQRQVRELHREVDTHARPTPLYAHFDREVREMQRLADHLHEAFDRGAGRAHLREDVRRLDRLVHRLEDHLAELRRAGQTGFVAAGHIGRVLQRVGRTVHHLESDLD